MKLIPLTRGKFAMVDDEDFERVNQFKWQARHDPSNSRFYATRHLRNKKRTTIQMHRFILKNESEHTDHKDGNGLNNQKSNLRPCTRTQNARNRNLQKHSSRYKGVSVLSNGQIVASIRIDKKKFHLGSFDDEILAALTYDMAAIKHFGEFALTNHQIGAL